MEEGKRRGFGRELVEVGIAAEKQRRQIGPQVSEIGQIAEVRRDETMGRRLVTGRGR